jgi:hypothetical protein
MGGCGQIIWIGGSQLGKTYLMVSAPGKML